MTNIYEKILDILGKNKDDPSFINFVSELCEKPDIVIDDKQACVFLFRQSGIQLIYFYHCQCFASAYFRLGNKNDRMQPYKGDLPFKIQFDDSVTDVEQKINIKPISSKLIRGCNSEEPKDHYVEYSLNLYVLNFIFGGSTQKLSSFSISYDPAFKF